MDTRHLRAFVAVAERGSFTLVAQEMYMAQSTISRQVAALEADLGVRLLERTRHEVRLTARGRVFLPYAKHVLDELTRATAAVREIRSDADSPHAWSGGMGRFG